MNTKVNLSKIRKCGQVWEDMNVCNGGRKCSKCANVITDFRGMSEWDIAVTHALSKDKVCGLYDKTMLNPHVKVKQVKRLWNVAVPGMIGLFLYGTQANAKTNSKIPQEQHQVEYSSQLDIEKGINNKQQVQNSDTIKVVRGYLYDSANAAIVGGNIIIDGTRSGTVTDVDGAFALDVTNDFELKEDITLIVAYIGYGEQRILISKEEFKNKKELKIEPIVLQEDYMMESFVVKRESLPKRLWRGIKNIFSKNN